MRHIPRFVIELRRAKSGESFARVRYASNGRIAFNSESYRRPSTCRRIWRRNAADIDARIIDRL